MHSIPLAYHSVSLEEDSLQSEFAKLLYKGVQVSGMKFGKEWMKRKLVYVSQEWKRLTGKILNKADNPSSWNGLFYQGRMRGL